MVGSLSGSSLINSGTFAGSDGGFQYQGAPSAPSTSGLSDYPFWPDVSGSQQSFGQAVKGGTIFDGGAAGVGASLGGGGVSFGGERDSFGGGGANFGGDGAGFGGGEFGGGFKFSGGFGSGGGIDRYPREPLLRGNGDELGPIPGVKNAGGAGGVDGGMVFAGQDGGTTAGGSTSFGGQDVGSLMIERNFGPGGFAGDLSGNGAGLFGQC
ncbi:hypothetical protein DPMN_014553 [Dreissena polymorpha]|uniref:Uncharacterized protein n=1 Tax=Dreissena polymorpha TaxID=45954 RepID=A0A9D4NBY0_DREPO|nr:hypothetical protein DPMN_014553 [Dreissena polymorpha]